MVRSSRSERVRQHTAEQRPSRAGADFEQFYAREYDGVAALAYVLTGSWAAGEDITQDAFVAASLAWDRIKTYDHPAAWVRRVVANRSASLVRRRLAEAHAVFRLARRSKPPAFDAPEAAEFWDAVRRLPRRQAQAVSLYYLEDWRTDEIAEVLGCTEATVRVHLHKARQALGQALGESRETS